MAPKEIIAQDKRNGVVLNETLSDEERFGNAARSVLDCIGNGEAEMLSFSKKSLKAGEIFRGGDDENIADIRLHENGERIVDQGFVVDREELFRCGLRHGIETAAFASCKDDPLHVLSSKV